MAKRKGKITYELLRKDATRAADFLENAAYSDFACGDITPETLSLLRHLATMLKGAAHIVIHDSNELPED